MESKQILQRMPWMAQDAVFKKLSEIAEVGSLDREERLRYDESLRHYRDTIVVMEGQFMEGERKGLEKGRAEGRAEGFAEGEKQRSVDIARKMKAKGMSGEEISEMTGLPLSDIQNLDK